MHKVRHISLRIGFRWTRENSTTRAHLQSVHGRVREKRRLGIICRIEGKSREQAVSIAEAMIEARIHSIAVVELVDVVDVVRCEFTRSSGVGSWKQLPVL